MSKHKRRRREKDLLGSMNNNLNNNMMGGNGFGNNLMNQNPMNNNPFTARNPLGNMNQMNSSPLGGFLGGNNPLNNGGMMGQNPMGQMGQMGQGPLRPNMMGGALGNIGGLLGGVGGMMIPLIQLFSTLGNSPIMQLLGNVDVNLISKLLFNNPNKNANNANNANIQNNADNANIANNLNSVLNGEGAQDTLTDLLSNLDGNKVNDLLKNVDQTQITNIINQLKNEGVMEDNPEGVFGNPESYDMGYASFADDEMNIGEENYSSLKMIKIINAMLNSGNTEFIEKVVATYNDYYGITE